MTCCDFVKKKKKPNKPKNERTNNKINQTKLLIASYVEIYLVQIKKYMLNVFLISNLMKNFNEKNKKLHCKNNASLLHKFCTTFLCSCIFYVICFKIIQYVQIIFMDNSSMFEARGEVVCVALI